MLVSDMFHIARWRITLGSHSESGTVCVFTCGDFQEQSSCCLELPLGFTNDLSFLPFPSTQLHKLQAKAFQGDCEKESNQGFYHSAPGHWHAYYR